MSEHNALQQQLDTLSKQWPDSELPLSLRTARALLQRARQEREPVAERLLQRAQQCLESVEPPTKKSSQILAPNTGLTELVSALQQDSAQSQAPVLSKLEQQIEEQTTKLLGEDAPSVTTEEHHESDHGGLRAAQKFERTRQRHAKRKTVAIALERRPENPGPLNPHMLAVKILSEVQDVSPAYLERYVTFVDALVSLDAGIKTWSKKSASQKKR